MECGNYIATTSDCRKYDPRWLQDTEGYRRPYEFAFQQYGPGFIPRPGFIQTGEVYKRGWHLSNARKCYTIRKRLVNYYKVYKKTNFTKFL